MGTFPVPTPSAKISPALSHVGTAFFDKRHHRSGTTLALARALQAFFPATNRLIALLTKPRHLNVLVGAKANGSEDRLIPDVTVFWRIEKRLLNTLLVCSPRVGIEVLFPSREVDEREVTLQASEACSSIQERVLTGQLLQRIEASRQVNEDAQERQQPVR